METKITADELAHELPGLLERVRSHGERFVVERDGEPVACLGPVSSARQGSLSDLVQALDAFGWPDEEFGNDLAAVHAA